MNDLAVFQDGLPDEGPSLEELIHRFKAAEDSLHAVLKGQADAVLDPVTAIPILLRDAHTHLVACESRYRRLLSRTGLVVFELDADGTTIFVNDSVTDILGYTYDELVGRNWWDALFSQAQSDQLEPLYARFQSGDVTAYELAVTTTHGSTAILELTSVTRRKQDGVLDSVLVLAADITERREAEREVIENQAVLERLSAERLAELTKANLTLTNLADMRQRLLEIEHAARIESEKANRMKVQFLSMVSHELRTPLAVVKGFTSTLLATDVHWDEESTRDFLTLIDAEADKLNALIEQLLDLSRLHAGTLHVQPKPISLNEIIDLALVELQAVATQHKLVFDLSADLPMIRADASRISGVLANLVGNAAKFAPRESQITISAARQDGLIQVDVSDEGPGIPADIRERVFELFWQPELRSRQHAKGAGLGLAICKGIVEAHGGGIWVADTPSGTTISFTLPAANTAKPPP